MLSARTPFGKHPASSSKAQPEHMSGDADLNRYFRSPMGMKAARTALISHGTWFFHVSEVRYFGRPSVCASAEALMLVLE
jgi:hypothetical protein